MRDRIAARLAWCACGLAVACGTATTILILIHRSEPLGEWLEVSVQELVVGISAMLLYSVFGALIVSRHPRNPIGWLFLLAGLGAAVGGLAGEYAIEALVLQSGSLPGGVAAAWLDSWAWILFVPVPGTIGLLLFPTGRLPSPRWRPVLSLAVAVNVGLIAGFGFRDERFARFPVDNPVGFVPQGIEAFAVLLLPTVALCFASLVFRYRRATGDERQALKWIAAAGALYLIAIATELAIAVITEGWNGLPTMLATAAVIVAIGTSVLRYRLYDLDLVVNRALVYGLLTALVLAGYVGTVTGLGELLDSSGIGVSLAATAVVAVAIQPLRSVIQRRVDRLMYGDRDDPYRALSRLGEQLGGALDPDQVLPVIVAAVADGLRVPYVGIELTEESGSELVAEQGERSRLPAVRIPLEHRGEPVGTLVTAPRPGSDALSPADVRLLTDFARQAGVAAHAVRLTHDLRRSRERLVATREEERRRLRRDLHDGLGPTFAAIALEIESALALVEREPQAAAAVLDRLKSEARDAIADIRRIAHDLRPPTLDELGLVAAVREQAARLCPNGRAPHFDVNAPAQLPALSAAVEVAAYRIVLEAMANVSRHARAERCDVRIAINGALEIEIRDDGTGIDRDRCVGVGLSSMRERAEELGGRFEVESASGRGTVVHAMLPLEGR
jgi:two-component system NarL family sensor kinase